MVSGAPAPGGFNAPAPGGPSAPAPGGLDLNNAHIRRQFDGYPDAQISDQDRSGARVLQSRSVVVRTGRTSVSTYAWTLPTRPGGSTATVTGGTTATASFTPDLAGLFVLQCVVTFADGVTVTRSVSYTSA
jgi:hypothetical protein